MLWFSHVLHCRNAAWESPCCNSSTAHDSLLCSRGSRTKHSTAIPSSPKKQWHLWANSSTPASYTGCRRWAFLSQRPRENSSCHKRGEKVSRILVHSPRAWLPICSCIIFMGSGVTVTTLIRVMLVRSAYSVRQTLQTCQTLLTPFGRRDKKLLQLMTNPAGSLAHQPFGDVSCPADQFAMIT